MGVDPLRAQVAGLHFRGDGAAGAFGDDFGCLAQDLHLQRRVFARQLQHCLRQSAQVPYGVVTGQHAVRVGRVGRTGQRRSIHLGEVAGSGVLQGLPSTGTVHAIHAGLTYVVHAGADHFRVTNTRAVILRRVAGVRRFT